MFSDLFTETFSIWDLADAELEKNLALLHKGLSEIRISDMHSVGLRWIPRLDSNGQLLEKFDAQCPLSHYREPEFLRTTLLVVHVMELHVKDRGQPSLYAQSPALAEAMDYFIDSRFMHPERDDVFP